LGERDTFALLRREAPKQNWREVSDAEYAQQVKAQAEERDARLNRLDEMGP